MKSSYTAKKIVTMLDEDKLEAIKKEFKRHIEGLDVEKFIWCIL